MFSTVLGSTLLQAPGPTPPASASLSVDVLVLLPCLSCTFLKVNKRVFPTVPFYGVISWFAECLQGDKYLKYLEMLSVITCEAWLRIPLGWRLLEKYKTVQSGTEQQFSPEWSSLLQGDKAL